MQDILIDHDGPVAIVTLNRPAAMNALSRRLRHALADSMRTIAADAAIRAVVLTGAGERAFCAGLDLKELGQEPGAVSAATGDDPYVNPIAALALCGRPIIAAINGACITGGLELALACDILVASTNARFADTHVKVEVLPGWGLSQRLSHRIGASRAKEMSLAGGFVDAATAAAWGLVNRVVAPDALVPAAVDIARAIATNAPAMVAAYRALIDDGGALPLGAGLALEAARSGAFNGGIDASEIEARREAVRDSNRHGYSAIATPPANGGATPVTQAPAL